MQKNTTKKFTTPENGIDAFYKGYSLEDNPYPEWDSRFEEWDKDYLETAKNYKQEGRFRDGTFKG